MCEHPNWKGSMTPNDSFRLNSSPIFSIPVTRHEIGSWVGLNNSSFCSVRRCKRTFSNWINFRSNWISGLTPKHWISKVTGSGLSFIQQTTLSWKLPGCFGYAQILYQGFTDIKIEKWSVRRHMSVEPWLKSFFEFGGRIRFGGSRRNVICVASFLKANDNF